MISLLPQSTETLVVAQEQSVVAGKLFRATAQTNRAKNPVYFDDIFFTGIVNKDRFHISLKITRPNSFVPVIGGVIEPTSSGCIIFVKYKLFPATRMYLSFWLLFIFLFGLFAAFHLKNFWGLLVSFAIAGAILLICRANFSIQRSLASRALRRVLDPNIPS